MPKIDITALPSESGSGYPAPYDAGFEKRHVTRLGKAAGLTQFGANLVRLEPGAMASQRHWHENQDEFLMVTKGTCTLVEDEGSTTLSPGDCAAFPAGNPNGHHLVNNSREDAEFLVIGTHSSTETGHYSDVDMMVRVTDGEYNFTRRDGSPIRGEGGQ
ncbi:hypothetical protein AIOL_004741 [Candidatus Rhodobacter oscarellae]|uniref:Cupin type-2 domain-containing protein n=1 Tax=Candidatus Rhodobacter oscarellae TaxID=1675527 RepID=A0A0J9H221_9RHOB|nr:cupin domain-containing protein [Candidatus Rhodobacter lobularis]KMW59758.1 hypothetical protein AIOL_004741 [Candidatus Rhodobacter lobularis]